MTNDFESNNAKVQQTSLDFIEIELELAHTFCRISKETNDDERRERNMQNANRAFRAATKAFRYFHEPGDSWTKTKANLDEVERELTCARVKLKNPASGTVDSLNRPLRSH